MGENEKQNIVRYGDVLFTLLQKHQKKLVLVPCILEIKRFTWIAFALAFILLISKRCSHHICLTTSQRHNSASSYIRLRKEVQEFNLCKADFEKSKFKLPSLENQKRIYESLKCLSGKGGSGRRYLETVSFSEAVSAPQMFI